MFFLQSLSVRDLWAKRFAWEFSCAPWVPVSKMTPGHPHIRSKMVFACGILLKWSDQNLFEAVSWSAEFIAQKLAVLGLRVISWIPFFFYFLDKTKSTAQGRSEISRSEDGCCFPRLAFLRGKVGLVGFSGGDDRQDHVGSTERGEIHEFAFHSHGERRMVYELIQAVASSAILSSLFDIFEASKSYGWLKHG